MVARGAKSIAALLVMGVVVPSALAGRESGASPAAARAPAAAARGKLILGPRDHALAQRIPMHLGGRRIAACPLAVKTAWYANPLAAATVKPERIDQGVDYAGSGTLGALGAARIAYVGTADTGWPGAFIEYQLLAGADAGCYVFYAEGITPEPGLQTGDTVEAGQPLATIIPHYPSGFEIGWGAGTGTKTYVGLMGQWTASDDQDNVASLPGKNFSALIHALGGPPGKAEG